MKWLTPWVIIRDVIVTGLGVYLIISQAQSAHPKQSILVIAAACIFPSVAQNTIKIFRGPGPSSPEELESSVSLPSSILESGDDDQPKHRRP